LVSVLAATINAVKTASLKHAMLAQGMTPEAIVQVIEARPGGPAEARVAGAVDLPCASEAVVASDGEWRAALVLKEADGRYYVHFVGTDMDENEWVGLDRIRFARDSHFVSSNGAPRKQPMEMEL
jgi:hypothetical protein